MAEPNLPPPVLEEDDLVGPESRRIVASQEEIEAVEAAQAEEQVTELTTEERNLFRSLLTIGKRVKTLNVMGHEVVIETLRSSDEMRIGLYTKEYEGSRIGFTRAYQCAVVAAGVQTIEGEALYTPLSDKESDETIFDKKVKKVAEMYPLVVSQIYDAITLGEAEFVELARKLGKIPG